MILFDMDCMLLENKPDSDPNSCFVGAISPSNQIERGSALDMNVVVESLRIHTCGGALPFHARISSSLVVPIRTTLRRENLLS
jgi:hypothetical protein